MTDSTATQPLELVQDGVYRNLLGAQLHAIKRLDEFGEPKKFGPLNLGCGHVFGEIWVMESEDEIFGTTQHLATSEGLTACGYQLVGGATE